MIARITVANRDEKLALEAGLGDQQVRAFVTVVGLLLPLSERARRRVLAFVSDQLDERLADAPAPADERAPV